jgi:hypothetical protein
MYTNATAKDCHWLEPSDALLGLYGCQGTPNFKADTAATTVTPCVFQLYKPTISASLNSKLSAVATSNQPVGPKPCRTAACSKGSIHREELDKDDVSRAAAEGRMWGGKHTTTALLPACRPSLPPSYTHNFGWLLHWLDETFSVYTLLPLSLR